MIEKIDGKNRESLIKVADPLNKLWDGKPQCYYFRPRKLVDTTDNAQ